MIVTKLKSDFEECLGIANEIWFAVALIKESTYDFIKETINENCKQHYLVGIDLPTQPQVLRKMQSQLNKGSFDASIYHAKFNFHPKFFLFKVDNNYTAFIGSSNLTDGGLENNVELNYKLKNQDDCLATLDWFQNLDKDAFPLTDDNISAYEAQFESLQEFEKELKKKRKKIELKKLLSSPLDDIDFSDRYFKKEHHLAFRRELWSNNSNEAIEEREFTKIKCIKLHNSIYSRFKDYDIQVLEPNPMSDHLISMIRQIDTTKPRPINAMWLSYGKNENEIKEYQKIVGADQKAKQTFIHHARLQLKIDFLNIGIYLLFAKENEGGLFDRDSFKTNMRHKEYRDNFYQMLKSLPNEYFISVGGKKEFCHKFNSADDLHNFCKKDDIQKYFIIGRDYQISDKEMSETNLPLETLKIFKLLFPFYEKMKHNF
ncbi:MAG: phospholipase D-like domain-containing protein [Flavobacterium sp.]